MKRKSYLWLLVSICLCGCAGGLPRRASGTPMGPTQTIVGTKKSPIEPYQDVRDKDFSNLAFHPDSELMKSLWFNNGTSWPKQSRDLAQEIMEKGKNPGLGVRGLHEQGITGKGVSVAIIDQNLATALDHPEFKGKITQYFDMGTKMPSDSGSMHGPAVASLLVGETIGTAPGATLYYVAAPSWTGDAQYLADALDWIIGENEQLPEGKKIRVVSVSAAPSGQESPFTLNNKAWDTAYEKATQAGILVLDCTVDKGITSACYLDLDDPDNVSKCTPGYPGVEMSLSSKDIFIPTSYRTTAEEYYQGDFSYQYTGRGGLSWSIPYLAGVLAMGWQVKPDLTNSQILDILYESAYVGEAGFKIINPPDFIEKVRQANTP